MSATKLKPCPPPHGWWDHPWFIYSDGLYRRSWLLWKLWHRWLCPTCRRERREESGRG